MHVELAPSAMQDLAEIGAFIGRDSPARAKAFVMALEGQCLRLRENFLRHPVLRGSETDSIRRLIYRDYLIFYRVEQTRVSVLRIVHGARDLDAIFDL